MKTSFFKQTICAVLAAGMIGSVAVETVQAQSNDRRDRYIERWYRDNGRDSDYRDWRRGRWDERDYRRWYRRHHRDNDRRDNLGAAAIFGLAAGALASGIIANQNRYPDTTGSVAAVPPAGGHPFGTAGYVRYCSAKYRSFDPGSGTFLGYDGQRHYCR